MCRRMSKHGYMMSGMHVPVTNTHVSTRAQTDSMSVDGMYSWGLIGAGGTGAGGPLPNMYF